MQKCKYVLLLTTILRWDVVSVIELRNLVTTLTSFNKLSRNISPSRGLWNPKINIS